jgi:pyruvate kinase
MESMKLGRQKTSWCNYKHCSGNWLTYAAMSERAECVMLNKRLYIMAAVRVLNDILRRMQAHQSKKASMLRPLSLAHRFAG